MRERFWLTNLQQLLSVLPLSHRSRGRARRNSTRLAVENSAIVETLESRQLLSGGSVAPVGTETQVNTFTTNSQKEPSVAADANGDYVVAWAAQSEDTSGYGIFAQRYNAAGVAQGSEFQVNTFTTGDQRAPSVAIDAAGAFVVVWTSNGQDGSGLGVYGQRFTAAGVAQGAEFSVNTYTTGVQNAPHVAMDAAGDFAVTWQSQGQDGSGYGVYVRRYNATGVSQGSEFAVNTSTQNDEGRPVIAMDASGDFVVTWLQYNTTPFNFFVDAQRYNASGVAVGTPVTVTSGLSFTGTPAVAMDSAGDFVVTWAQYIYDGVDPHSYGIYAQRYNAQAAPQGDIFLANTTLTGGQVRPAVAMDPEGNFVITWSSYLQDGDSFGIYGQGFDPTGARIGTEFRVNTNTTNQQDTSAVAMDTKGDLVAVWASYFGDGSEDGIFSQRYKLPANHPPVGMNHTVTTLEDTPYVFHVSDFGFTDPNDNPSNSLLAVKITTLPAKGTLTDSGVAVSAGQFVSVADITAGKLIYTPPANANGTNTSSFTFQVQDNGGVQDGGSDIDAVARTLTINVTSVNDAPAGTSRTATTLEDTAYILKTSDFGFTDPNDSPANSLLAVKITLLPTLGVLTIDGLAVTAGQFVSVSDIIAGKLIFKPKANINGGPYFLCKFQVQDNGGTANAGVDLDPVAKVLDIQVTSVNDAPVGTSTTITWGENVPYVFHVSDFGFTDPNDSPPNSLFTVKITTLPTHGTLTDSSTVLSAGKVVPVADILAGKLIFTPPVNLTGTNASSFTFQVQDNGGTANGGVNLDPNAKSLSFNLVPVNDAPVGASSTVTTLEDTAYIFKTSDFGFTDPKDIPANSLLAVKITLLPTLGVLTDDGVAVTAGQFVSASDIAAGKLSFKPNANINGGPYFVCKFQVEDNGGTALGGADLDPVAKVLNIKVTSVNDAPAGTSTAITWGENSSYVFKVSDFGFTDPNDRPANSLLAVKITTLPTHGTLWENGVIVPVGQFVPLADIAHGKLTFTPSLNATGMNASSFTFQVQDNGGTANGGANLDPSAKSVSFNLMPVNDAPVGTSKTVTGLEDTSYVLKTSDFGFTDPKDTPANSLLAVKITLLPTLGVLTDNGVAVTAGQFVSASDIAAGKLLFKPKANINGGPYFLCKFQVQDNGGTAFGGVDLDPVAKVLNIQVTGVNDAPSGTSKMVAVTKGSSYTFKVSDFGFTDSSDTPPNTFLALKLTTLPVVGQLADNGVALTAGSKVSAADIMAGKLKYTPGTIAVSGAFTSFTFQVQDNGGTANGGLDTDPTARTMNMSVS